MAFTPFSNGQYNSSAPTLSNGDLAPLQLDVNGNLMVVSTGGGGGDVNLKEMGGVAVTTATPYGTAPSTVSPARVQVSSGVVSGGGSNISISLPGSTPTGNLVLLSVNWDGNDTLTLPTATDGLGNTYSAVASLAQNTSSPSSNLSSLIILGTVVTNPGTITATIAMHGARGAAIAAEYSNGSLTLDGSAQNAEATTGTSLTTSAISTTNPVDLLIAIAGSETAGSATMTAGSGFSIYQQGSWSLGCMALEDQVVSSTGSYAAAISGMPSGGHNAILYVALKATASNTNSVPVNAYITNTPSVTVNAGTALIGHVEVDDGSGHIQPAGDAVARSINVQVNDGTNVIGSASHPVQVSLANTASNATAVSVQDVADGSVTAGSAASKSTLVGGVAATAAPTPTAGQQIAMQLDTNGNQRVSPFGQTGSFQVVTATGAGNTVVSFTVPAATKYIVKSVLISVTVTTGTKTAVILAATTTGGTTFAVNALGVSFTATSNITFGPSLAQSAAFVSGEATAPFPELAMGPGTHMTTAVTGGAAGDTINLLMNVIAIPD